jgi:hemerythrin-like domain-containing protein
MCEYCGCQDIPVIAELTAEHDALRGLAREVAAAARADDLGAVRALAAEIRGVLGPHTAVEEGGLFPALAADFPAQVATLIAEHHDIDAAFEEVAGDTPAAGWPARLVAAVEHLFEHILKEQDGVFPAALANLGPAQWDAVAAARSTAGSGLHSRSEA